VLSGDFCQLPPVPGRDKTGKQILPKFAFDAESWDACVGPPVMLTKVFRQKDQGLTIFTVMTAPSDTVNRSVC
jgi:ATP-dependent DNA helicase PIF1